MSQLWKVTRDVAVAGMADHTSLSGIAVHHADDGCSRRGRFGGLLVHNLF